MPAKQPWWIWITNTSCEFIMNDCITTTKQSTTKPCAYFLGYTVHVYRSGTNNHMPNIWFKLVWIELLSSLSSLVIFKTSFLHRHAAIIVLPLTLVSPFLLFLSTWKCMGASLWRCISFWCLELDIYFLLISDSKIISWKENNNSLYTFDISTQVHNSFH